MSKKSTPSDDAADILAFLTSVPGLIAVGISAIAIIVAFIAGLF